MENIAPNRIKEMRLMRGMSLSELSELTGMTRSELHKLEKGVRRIRTDHLPPLSQSLRCGPEELLNAELAEQLMGDRMKYTLSREGADGPAIAADLPVYGAVVDGAFSISDAEPQAYVQRSPNLVNVKTSFAVYQPDESMEPRISQGNLLYVNPILPSRAGDIVLATWKDGTAKVLMLSQERGAGLIGTQENSDVKIVIAEEDGIKLQRVIGISFI